MSRAIGLVIFITFVGIGLNLVKQLGLHNIIIEIDSKTITDLISMEFMVE